MNKNITFKKLTDEYLEVRAITRKRHTVKMDISHVKYMNIWLQGKGRADTPFRTISRYDIEKLSLWLATPVDDGGRGLDRGSCLKYYDTLCNIYNFAIERGVVKERPLDLFKAPIQREDHSAQLIPEEKLAEMLLAMEKRDYQMFVASTMVLACGLRPRTELRLRKVKDFDLKQGFVRIPVDEAKVHKARIVTMPSYVVEILRTYGLEEADGESYLFGHHHTFGDKPVTENVFCYRFNKYRDEFNLPKGVVFYSLKPNGAKLFLDACNGNVVALMEHLGHSKLTTTQVYVSKKLGLVNTRYQQNAIDPRTLIKTA